MARLDERNLVTLAWWPGRSDPAGAGIREEILRVPDDERWLIRRVALTNKTNATKTITLYLTRDDDIEPEDDRIWLPTHNMTSYLREVLESVSGLVYDSFCPGTVMRGLSEGASVTVRVIGWTLPA